MATRYTYTVEIDGRQAIQQAQQLRQQLGAAMGEIAMGGKAGGGSGAPDKALAATAKQMQQIAQIDLTRPIDDLRAELARLNKEIARAEHDILSTTVIGSGPSRATSQRLNEYADNLRRFVSEEAANRARSGLTHGGTLNAQFGAVDDTLDPDSMNTRAWAEVKDRRKWSQEQTREYLQTLAQMYEQQIQATRIEKELAQREMTLYGNAMAVMDGSETGEYSAQMIESYAKAEEQVQRMAQAEAELMRDLEKARADHLAAINKAEKAPKKTAAATDTTSVRQTISATKASADNAERMADNAERMAKSSKEYTEWLERGAVVMRDNARYTADASMTAEEVRKAAEIAIQQNKRQTADAEAQSRERIALADREAKEKIEAAKQTTAITKAEEAERRAAAQQSTALTRAETTERVEAARRETLEKRRLYAQETDQYKREMAERRKALAGEARRFQTMNLGTLGRSVAFSLMGAVGIYSADQVARQLYTAGKTGAQQIRQRDTFENLAAGVNQSADSLVRSIREASKETINETQAMGLAAQVLAQKFAGEVGDMEGSLATLTSAARRYSQIFTDEQGAFLTTEEIFARLIKFVREGNKELVDQFGISNARIADVLGIDKNGLASATGAADRYRGLIAILEEDLGRFGEAQVSLADEIEASESRMAESMNRIRRKLAPTAAAVAQYFADIIDSGRLAEEAAATAAAGEITDSLRIQAGNIRRRWDSSEIDNMPTAMARKYSGFNQNAQRMEDLAKLIEISDQAARAGVPGAKAYAEALRAIGEEAATTGEVMADYDRYLSEAAIFFEFRAANAMNAAKRMAAGAPDPMFADTGAGRSVEQYMAQVDTTKSRVEKLAEAIAQADAAVEAGVDGAQEYADRLRDVAREAQAGGRILPEHMQLIGEVGRWYLNTAEDAIILAQAIGEIASAVYGVGPVVSGFLASAGRTAGGLVRSPTSPAGFQQTQDDILAGIQSEDDRFQAKMAIMRGQNAQDRMEYQYQYRIAEAAKNEWERAADAAADAWASELKAALEGVPGLYGTSDVTAEDMRDAELGIYEEKADEYLRQLRDEIRNGKDYPGVDVRDAAARLGLDPNLDPEIILRKFEEAWADSSLFAGGANLDLINEEAVQRELDQQRKAKEGRDAIAAYFGLPTEGGGGSVGAAAGQSFVETASAEAPAIGQAIADGMKTEDAAMATDTIQARQIVPVDGSTLRAGSLQVDRLIFPPSVIQTLPRLTVGALDLPTEGLPLAGRVRLDSVYVSEQAIMDIQAQLAGLTVGPQAEPTNPAAYDWSQFGMGDKGGGGREMGAQLAGEALAGFVDYDFDGMARALVSAFSVQISTDTYKDAFNQVGQTAARYVMSGARDEDLLIDLAERFLEDLIAAITAAITEGEG